MAWAGSRGPAGDVCQLPVRDESFDIVISSEMLEGRRRAGTGDHGAPAYLADGRPARPDHAEPRLAERCASGEPAQIETISEAGELCRVAPSGAVVFGGRVEVLVHRGFHPWPLQLGLNGAARAVEGRLARGGGREMDGQSGHRRLKAGIAADARVTPHLGWPPASGPRRSGVFAFRIVWSSGESEGKQSPGVSSGYAASAGIDPKNVTTE
jgi:hypothetical protein